MNQDKIDKAVERVAEYLKHYSEGSCPQHCEERYIPCATTSQRLRYDCNTCWAQAILFNTEHRFAIVDPMCSSPLKWERTKESPIDQDCDFSDCGRGIKKGEPYYFADYGEGNGHTYCIECAAYFMAQKLSCIIPLEKNDG